MGNVGIAQFLPGAYIGAVNVSGGVRGGFDTQRAIERCPEALRNQLRDLSSLPLLQDGKGVSMVFWSMQDEICGPVGWDEMLNSGVDIFELEFLRDDGWIPKGMSHWGISETEARLAVTLAARARLGKPLLELQPPEVAEILPLDRPHRSAALELLMQDGYFLIAR